jgi:type IV pilus assembly protein PilB
LAQRLVRVVCAKCKQAHTPADAELQLAGISAEQAHTANFAKGRGCGSCQQTGYRGRLGIFEMMLMSPKIRELTFQGAALQDVRKAAISLGMTTLYDDGIKKVLAGITTLEEIFRVAKQSA